MRMKASFLRPPPAPLSRSAARNAALLNQCATPGLGSLMAGRRLAGIGQLLLAIRDMPEVEAVAGAAITGTLYATPAGPAIGTFSLRNEP